MGSAYYMFPTRIFSTRGKKQDLYKLTEVEDEHKENWRWQFDTSIQADTMWNGGNTGRGANSEKEICVEIVNQMLNEKRTFEYAETYALHQPCDIFIFPATMRWWRRRMTAEYNCKIYVPNVEEWQKGRRFEPRKVVSSKWREEKNDKMRMRKIILIRL